MFMRPFFESQPDLPAHAKLLTTFTSMQFNVFDNLRQKFTILDKPVKHRTSRASWYSIASGERFSAIMAYCYIFRIGDVGAANKSR